VAEHSEITASLRAFQEGYNKNKRLKKMNADWDRIVLVQANDIPSTHTLILRKGELTIQEGPPEKPDLKIISDSETLADMFYGDITPTQPYLNGTLKVLGTEDDIVRLDFISLMIWGE
jgi:putative sterol carrier protein